jgi:hypothetical protein
LLYAFFYLFTFLPLREQPEELGIYLIYDFTKLLGIVLEIEIINFYDKHLALILVHDEIFVKIVDTFVKNIQKRGRDYEQKMPLDYLEGINNLYEDFIMNKYKGKVLIVEVDNLDFEHNPKQFGEIVDKIDAKLFGLFS